MFYVVSEYAKYQDDVVLNVEIFDNEVRAKNYMQSRIDEFKTDYYVRNEFYGENFSCLENAKCEYWIKLCKREMY